VRFPRWSVAPPEVIGAQRKNFRYVQIDAIAIGLTSAAAPFLPVFLARLGATNLQIGLLTALPGFTGLILAVFIGRFLQNRRNIVPWFSASRLLVVSAYAATGLAPFVVPENYLVVTILAIWALATIPQISLAVCFSVVMNAVAGPDHRFDLMSRRWSILGLTTTITVAIAGQVLERFSFPINYQVVFTGLSIGGLLSFYYSSRITLPDSVPPPALPGRTIGERVREYFRLVLAHQDFINFSIRRFVFQFGVLLATPLLPIYYVREVHASDAWIGYFSTAQTATLLIGYFMWPRQSRRRGTRFVLLCSTLGLSFYPALVAATQTEVILLILAGLAGVFQAGLELVFFDELMKTVPVEYSATFVSLAQSMTYLATVLGPLVGTYLSDQIGLNGALLFSTFIRLSGFALFTAPGLVRGRRGAAQLYETR
jgi:Major Facilitator Superfamily